jgi:hypothetical protein
MSEMRGDRDLVALFFAVAIACLFLGSVGSSAVGEVSCRFTSTCLSESGNGTVAGPEIPSGLEYSMDQNAIPSQSGSPSENGQYTNSYQMMDKNASIQYHLLTEGEMADLKGNVGVREAGRDYNVIINGHGTGLAPPYEEEWERAVGSLKVVDSVSAVGDGPAATFDMSSEPYFPAVGNQAGQGSCAAWAMTYYDYGYLEALDNGWTDASAGNQMHLISSAWTYNKVNGGGDYGSWTSTNGYIIRDWGTATLSTMPYNDDDPLSWGGQAAFREAPLHRASDVYFVDFNGNATVTSVKNLLSSHIPVTFALDAYEFGPSFSDGNTIMSASEYSSSDLNHAQTFVGYDDSITDDGEVGAFKVVNSWGTHDGYTDHGYYWMTYDCFKEIGDMLFLTYIADMPDYVPSMLSVWHFNSAPSRNANIEVGIGPHGSPLDSRSPYYEFDSDVSMPTFMCLDISEFSSEYEAGTEDFYLEIGSSSMTGTISSFRIENYVGSFVPGIADQVSAQSPDVPSNNPDYVTVNLDYYPPMPVGSGLENDSLPFSGGGVAGWVYVDHHSYQDGDSVQSGDIGDSAYTFLSTEVEGPTALSFYWKVSSQAGADFLRFYVDFVEIESISGEVDWQQVSKSLSEGSHTLVWQYSKDGGISTGEDCGWVDMLGSYTPDDQFEENDDVGSAASIESGTYANLSCLDNDWYKFYLYAGDDLTAGIDFSNADGDLQLYLYDTDGSTLLDSSTTASDYEEVNAVDVPQFSYYYLLVQGNGGATNGYSMTIDIVNGGQDPGDASTVQITSGTGSFSGISTSNKQISVLQGGSISGSITLTTKNEWSPFSTVQMIWTPSWGTHSSSYVTANASVSTGTSVHTVGGMNLVAPFTVGQYYMVFAFREEGTGGHVASATSSALGGPTWDDGNDIAGFSSTQVSEAQLNGRTSGNWLLISGFGLLSIPSDAIVIEVQADGSAPTTTVSLSGTSGINGWYKSSVTVALSASDGGGSGVKYINYSVDGSSWRTYGAPLSVSTEGKHTVDYYSVDNVGNEEIAESKSFKIDSNVPSTRFELTGTAGANGWYVSNVEVSLSASDATSGIQYTRYRIDGGVWHAYGAPVTFNIDGQHDFDYYSVDMAGNSETSNSMDVKIDKTAPEIAVALNGTLGLVGWFVSEVNVTLTPSDGASGIDTIRYRIDGGAWVTYSLAFNVNESGQHVLEYYAADVAGNMETTKNVGVWVDEIAPETVAEFSGTYGSGGWYRSSVEVNLSAVDAHSGMDRTVYRVDGGSWVNFTAPFAVTGEGEHSIEYSSLDEAGNQESVETATVSIDTHAPTGAASLSGTVGSNGWYVSEVMVSLSVSDGEGSGVSGTMYRIDGSQWIEYEDQFEISEAGTHEFDFYSIDLSGNSQNPVVVVMKIDKDSPTLIIDSDAGKVSATSHDVLVAWSSSDPISSLDRIEVKVDDGDFATYPGSQTNITLRGLIDGEHTLRIRAVDVAGNTVEQTVTIDVTTNPFDPEGPMGPWLIIGVAALLFVIIAAIVAYLVTSKRKRKQ